jgi:hypothetical protein
MAVDILPVSDFRVKKEQGLATGPRSSLRPLRVPASQGIETRSAPGKMMRFKKLLAVAGATVLLPLSAPPVYAQSGTEGYSGSNVVAGLEDGGDSADGNQAGERVASAAPADTSPVQTPADDGGSLPFTGADLAVLAAASGVLVALGFGLRRLTDRPTP